MSSLVTKLKYLNRRRNIKTKLIKLKLQIIASDAFLKRRTTLPRNPQQILILMIGKGIGDAIVMTGFIKALTEMGRQVSVMTETRLSAIFNNHPLVQNHFILNRNETDCQTLLRVKELKFDLLIDLDNIDIHSPLRVRMIRTCKPAHTIGVNQFARVYDTSINDLPTNKHITQRHISIVKFLGGDVEKLNYTIRMTQSDDMVARKFIGELNLERLVIVNPYGTEESRNMSLTQISGLCSLLKERLNVLPVVVGLLDKISLIPNDGVFVKFTSENFNHTIALVKHADLVISTDTSVVHLCNALNKKLICLYNNKKLSGGEENNIVWGPNYEGAVQMFSVNNRVDEIQPVNIVKVAGDLLGGLT